MSKMNDLAIEFAENLMINVKIDNAEDSDDQGFDLFIVGLLKK